MSTKISIGLSVALMIIVGAPQNSAEARAICRCSKPTAPHPDPAWTTYSDLGACQHGEAGANPCSELCSGSNQGLGTCSTAPTTTCYCYNPHEAFSFPSPSFSYSSLEGCQNGEPGANPCHSVCGVNKVGFCQS